MCTDAGHSGDAAMGSMGSDAGHSVAAGYPLLERIVGPEVLRRCSVEELPAVCAELRAYILSVLAGHPGHLASSLGTVELTVALHYVLSTPADRIVWDVGHQAYAHKILTGRYSRFRTLRTYGGLAPFPSPAESSYDTFVAGHASNSISAALGMSVAARQQGLDRKIVVVIGDGAMSGGLAFEGLNNVSSTDNDLLIILNDNDMSIDHAVGGMAKYLLSMSTSATYNRVRYFLSRVAVRLGLLSPARRRRILRFNNAVKALLSRQQNMFEGLNIRYFGPVDGHDVAGLIRVLRQVLAMKGPKLLHVHTTKGKGYAPAEKDPATWHAPGRFDVATGQRVIPSTTASVPSYSDIFGSALVELAQHNDKIVAITPAMPSGCGLTAFARAYPSRFFDVGIAEGHAVTFAAGMAKDGLLPFCNIYSSFAQRAYDNIIHDVAILGLPVVLCLDRAGLVGEDGATHHGCYDLAALRVVPNLTICSPMDAVELRNMLYTAQLPARGPFVIRYPRGAAARGNWHEPFSELPVGKGRKLREGDTTAILSLGPIGNNIAVLLGSRTDIAHYDLRYVKPLDEALLAEVGERYRRVITVEDGCRAGGVGSAVTEWYVSHGYTSRRSLEIICLGIPDRFIPHGPISALRRLIGLDNPSIGQYL